MRLKIAMFLLFALAVEGVLASTDTLSSKVFNYGIRFNALRYEFDSSNNDLYPSSDKLAKPNGSGLDFIIGACYSF